ncbi:urease accessory UreF family protein [Cognatishimia sp. WU-CL00825]
MTLTQWLSPAYPVGGFAFSHGLESAIAKGWVSDAASLQAWLGDILRHGSGKSDAAWIWCAYRAPDAAAVQDLDAMARAFAPARERLRESERQGAAFVRVTAEVWGLTLAPHVFPVALGHAAQLVKLDPEAAVTLYLQAFLSNLTAAAQRLMPLGQTAAQRVLAQLGPACVEVAQIAANIDPTDISSSAFLSDIAAMQHETLEPRLFQS